MAALTTTVPEMHVIWETEELVTFLHPRPWTPGTTVVTQKTTGGPSSLFQLPERDFLSLLLGARVVGALLCERLGVRRCALLHYPNRLAGPPELRLLPLHGLEADWKPHNLPVDQEQASSLGRRGQLAVISRSVRSTYQSVILNVPGL